MAPFVPVFIQVPISSFHHRKKTGSELAQSLAREFYADSVVRLDSEKKAV